MQKHIKHIGEIKGPLLVFGGPYSNFQALEKMHKIAVELNIPPSNIICTGDVVGYCAQPEETVQFIMDWGIYAIAGNVEIQLREGKEDCGCDFKSGTRCDVFSRQWYPFAKSILSEKSIDWMRGLPEFIQFIYSGKKATVVHGSFFETSEYIFKSTPWAIKNKNFEAADSDIILAGHCGLPFYGIKNKKYWLNPGVIGMPANDGTPRVWYMFLNISKNGELLFEHRSFIYENKKAAALMRENNLPPEYALTLETGIWDNMEILPEEEKLRQGKAIDFNGFECAGQLRMADPGCHFDRKK